VLADPIAFSTIVDLIVVHFGRGNVDKVVGIEARGFILAAPVAYHFGAGIIPVRKKGKLPAETVGQEYALEYGTASLEIHKDAVRPGERVLWWTMSWPPGDRAGRGHVGRGDRRQGLWHRLSDRARLPARDATRCGTTTS
jgi:hypothetical protein